MLVGAGHLKLAINDAEEGSDIPLTIDVPLRATATTGSTIAELVSIVDGTTVENSRTQLEGPLNNAI